MEDEILLVRPDISGDFCGSSNVFLRNASARWSSTKHEKIAFSTQRSMLKVIFFASRFLFVLFVALQCRRALTRCHINNEVANNEH